MDDIDRSIQQEKKLERRSWLGWLLMSAVIIGLIGFSFRLIDWFVPRLVNAGPPGTASFLLAAVLMLGMVTLLVIVAVAVFFLILRWSAQAARRNFERSTQVLQNTLPQAVPETEKKSAGSPFSFRSVILFVLAVIGISLLSMLLHAVLNGLVYRAYSGAPGWLPSLASWILAIAAVLGIGWLYTYRRSPAAEREPLTIPEMLLRLAGGLLYLAFTLLPLLALVPLASKMIASLLLMPILLVLFTLGFGVLNMVYLLAPTVWVLAALKRGAYETSIHRAQWMEKLSVFRGAFLNLHGFALYLSGEFEPARQSLQDAIQATRQELHGGGSDGLTNTGCILSAQGQYAEAIPMFEGAIQISPRTVGAYIDLAEALLAQGGDPRRALDLTDRAMENFQASWLVRWLERFQLGSIWATRAWALAQLGQPSEAEQAIQQALACADRSFLPEYAGLLYRLGHVENLLGSPDRARDYWRAAARLDPRGLNGRQASEALKGS
jgi:Tfp pilus assembly protein PilF